MTAALALLASLLLASCADGLVVGALRPSAASRGGASCAATGQQQIEVVSSPDEAWLESKGVYGWGTWGCEPSTFPWSYSSAEACYLLEGDVTVTPTDGRAAATFGKGDYVTFPAGMSCTWEVRKAVKKHFLFF